MMADTCVTLIVLGLISSTISQQPQQQGFPSFQSFNQQPIPNQQPSRPTEQYQGPVVGQNTRPSQNPAPNNNPNPFFNQLPIQNQPGQLPNTALLIKPGTCPASVGPLVTPCNKKSECDKDDDCIRTRKCCGCPSLCIKPAGYERPGPDPDQCPLSLNVDDGNCAQYPGRDSCNNDCPKGQVCCPGRCGFRSCIPIKTYYDLKKREKDQRRALRAQLAAERQQQLQQQIQQQPPQQQQLPQQPQPQQQPPQQQQPQQQQQPNQRPPPQQHQQPV